MTFAPPTSMGYLGNADFRGISSTSPLLPLEDSNSMSKNIPCLVAVSLTLLAACASRQFNVGAETEVVGGTVVQSDKYPGLLQLKSLQCSGVKIGPNHILTARHCVKFTRAKDTLVIAHIDPAARAGTRGALVEFRASVVNVTKHPDTDSAKNIDLALLEIEPTASFRALRTAELDDDAVENGDRVQVVGFGCTDRSDTSDGLALAEAPTRFARPARAASPSPTPTPTSTPTPSRTNVTRTSPTETTCEAVVSGSAELSTATNLACQMRTLSDFQSVPGLCYGDSGGPLYTGSSPYRVVGVNSNFRPGELAGTRSGSTLPRPSGATTSSSTPRYGVSKFVRVDAGVRAHQEWIENAVAGASRR